MLDYKETIIEGILKSEIHTSTDEIEKMFKVGQPIVMTYGGISGYYIDHRVASVDPQLSIKITTALTDKVVEYVKMKEWSLDEIYIISPGNGGFIWGGRVAYELALPFH